MSDDSTTTFYHSNKYHAQACEPIFFSLIFGYGGLGAFFIAADQAKFL